VPSRVSEIHVGVITTGGHKTLPYDVVVGEGPGVSSIAFAAASSLALIV
jgi:hypothetical protein